MKGDFSRLTFRPDKRYSAVLAQQGRPQLDSDFNEQAAIQEYLRRTLVVDLIGLHAGPVNTTEEGTARCTAFEIGYLAGENGSPANLTIGGGRYYVGGLPADASVPGRPGQCTSTSTSTSTSTGTSTSTSTSMGTNMSMSTGEGSGRTGRSRTPV